VSEGKTLAQLLEELNLATGREKEAAQALDHARSHHISATNALNQAQKSVDEAFDKLKKAAPRDSDWHRSLRRGTAQAVTS
jgi:predicted  nucleic acid-binding Zn-ribbon protein